jgi:CelD/BcsL family acetyltransferase involved in cellulose biosynthesis
MLHLEPLDYAGPARTGLDSFADRVIFQTPAWLSFIAAAQRAEPVVAAVKDGPDTVGYFTGAVVERYGFRVLGSPLPGWTTCYQGFNLIEGVSRRAAFDALFPFAFRTLRCSHVEVRDRWLAGADLAGADVEWSPALTHLIDLHADEDALFARMTSACRRNIRKAARSGVVVEPATDPGFADEYYDQLRDVFAKQGLVPTYRIDRVRALIEHLGPTGNLLLLRARDPDGRCIASAIFPWFRQTMYFWGGASYRPDQHLRPNEAIIWHALRYAKSHGVTEFDFVGRGSYKTKYGTTEQIVPWARRSRSALVAGLRNAAREGFALRQRASAGVAALRGTLVPPRGKQGDPVNGQRGIGGPS